MLAVIEAKVPDTVPFILQVVPQAQALDANSVTGKGTPRDLADFLHYRGVPHSKRVAPVLHRRQIAKASSNTRTLATPRTTTSRLRSRSSRQAAQEIDHVSGLQIVADIVVRQRV